MIRPKLLTTTGDADLYIGEAEFSSGPGEFIFKVPLTVTRIHVVCVGAGAQSADNGYNDPNSHLKGGGGGGLGWKNNIEVEPGEELSVQVGRPVGVNASNVRADIGGTDESLGDSWIKRTDDDGNATGSPLVRGNSPRGFANYQEGGDYDGDGGGQGGNGCSYQIDDQATIGAPGSGGGAGGYIGKGGGGVAYDAQLPGNGGGGSGGASEVRWSGYNATGTGARGGGVGLRGLGASGASVRPNEPTGRTNLPLKVGLTGSGSEETYGAGGRGGPENDFNPPDSGKAGHGAVRIIWGNQYSFPENADVK